MKVLPNQGLLISKLTKGFILIVFGYYLKCLETKTSCRCSIKTLMMSSNQSKTSRIVKFN